MRTITLPIISLFALTSCVEQIYQDSIAEFPPGADATSSSTAEPPSPTTSAGSGVQTVTGDVDSTGGTGSVDPDASSGSSGEMPVNLPPTIELFEVSPTHLGEAGPAEINLIVSEDVVRVRLSLDGKMLDDNLKPGDFPYKWDALSAKDNGDKRTFEVVVEDAEGLTAMKKVELSVLLPASGIEKCLFEDPDKGAVTSVISALKYTDDAIIAVGSRDTGAGLRLIVWKLDPDHCEVVLPGWPKTIANWNPAFAGMTSIGAAVDVDADGNIVVAGNFIVGGKPQSYVALLNQAGSKLWEKVGQIGDTVAGVAAATAQFKNRVFVVGSQRTSDVPVRTDAAIWTYMRIEDAVSVSSWRTLKAPFTPDEFEPDEANKRSEWVHAVILQPATGYALAVGERELQDDDQITVYNRAFVVRVHPLGDVVGAPWTSWAPALGHDAIRAVDVCGDRLLAGGWTRDHTDLNAKPQPIIFQFQADGTFIQHRHLPQLSATQLAGLACDREGKIVGAGTRTSGSSDAQVVMTKGQSDPPVWYENGVAVSDDGAGAVACDLRGFCGWGGYRTKNMKPYAVVRVHHP